MPIDRRSLLASATVLAGIPSAGCLGDDDDRRIAMIDGLRVDDPPQDAEITDGEEIPVSEFPALEGLLEQLAEPDEELETIGLDREDCEAEFPWYSTSEGTAEERGAIADRLDELPFFAGEDTCYPDGFYLGHLGIAAAVQYVRAVE